MPDRKATIRNHTEYYREYRLRKFGKPDYNQEDMEQCLLCNKWFVMVGGHVFQTHKMFMHEYKAKFSLDRKRGRTHGKFRQLKAETNRNITNLQQGKKYRWGKGAKIGTYQRSQETLARLSKLGKIIGKIYGGRNKKIGGETT